MPSDETRLVRLRDVAERAGVSVGSASNAFGHPELVSEGVRVRVLTAATELGYAGPDPNARRLRLGHAGAVGVIFSERLRYQFTDPAALPLFAGLAAGMAPFDRNDLAPVHPVPGTERDFAQPVVEA